MVWGGTANAIHEREVCLGEIAIASGEPGAAVAAQFTHQAPSFFGSASPGPAHGITAYIDAHPEQIFAHLESTVTDIGAVVALFHWQRLARNWRSLLAAEVFCRMFDPRPIERREALRLVAQIREVIRTLSLSPTREDYDKVYGAIDSWLSGTPVTVALEHLPETALRRSHMLVARLLDRAQAAITNGEGGRWIDDFLWDRECWWESADYKIKDGTISAGSGEDVFLAYMFPSLRLAITAVGDSLGRPGDAAGRFMEKRYNSHLRAVAALRKAHHSHDPADRETVCRELEGSDSSGIRDEWVLGASGHTLVLLGKLDQAEDRLRRALRSPLIDGQWQAQTLYNLSCVLARTAREQECRETLEQAIHLAPRLQPGLAEDEDFSSVRQQSWFQSLVLPTQPEANGEAPESPHFG